PSCGRSVSRLRPRHVKKLRQCLHHGNLIVAWRALSPSIPRAKRRDPGGRWGLTAQRGQAEVRCQMMNANLWPKELSEREESPTHQQQHGVHSAGGEVTVGEPQQSQSGRYLYIDARA